MNNFLTLFNINFINQGLTLIQSLVKNIDNFNLFVVCLDSEVFNILKKENFKNVKLINLKDLEFNYSELLNVKNDRKLNEYFWTLTPFVIKYCLEVLKEENITYIDADLFFLKSPNEIFKNKPENKNVIITRHNYSEDKLFLEKTSGTYCVQFMYFNNEESSLKILNKWAEQCIEWCYDYYDKENDRFGDQKYLESWSNYENVLIVNDISFAAGPWNMHKISKEGNINNITFYHFHDFKIKDTKIETYNLIFSYRKEDSLFCKLYLNYIKNIFRINKYISAKYGVKKIESSFVIIKILLFLSQIKNKFFKRLLYKTLNILKKISLFFILISVF